MYKKICYGLGDLAVNGMFTFVSTYILFYYTDIEKISLATVGTALFLGRSMDAVFSVIVGGIVDRTQTKWGKCRPFLVWFGIPLGLMLIFLFAVPDIGIYKGLYCGVTYVLFSIFFSLVNVPYTTMASMISKRDDVRIQYNVLKMLGANLGGVLVTAFTLSIVQKNSAGFGHGYTKTACLYAVIAIAALLICAFVTKETVQTEQEEKMRIKEFGCIAKQNKNWLIFCVVMFFSLLYMTLHNQSTIYYMKYYLGKENLSSFILSMTPFICMLAALIMPPIASRVGMKATVCAGNLITIFALAGTWLAGRNEIPLLIFSILTSVGWAVSSSMIFVMLPQLIDYSEWKSGRRPQGLMSAIVTFLMKMGVAMAGFICPLILKCGGYTSEVEASESVLTAIRMAYIFIPLLLAVLVMVLMKFYSLDHVYGQIASELKERETKTE